MPRPRPGRRVTVVLVAVLVVCSFAGAPVAVAAAGTSSLTGELTSDDGTLSISMGDAGGDGDAVDAGDTADADSDDTDGADAAADADSDDTDGADDADSDDAGDTDDADADDTDDADGTGHVVRSVDSSGSDGDGASSDRTSVGDDDSAADVSGDEEGDDEPSERSIGDRLSGAVDETVGETVDRVEETTDLETDAEETDGGDALANLEPRLVSTVETVELSLHEATSLEEALSSDEPLSLDGATALDGADHVVDASLLLAVFELTIETGGLDEFGTSGDEQVDVESPLEPAEATATDDVEPTAEDDRVATEVSDDREIEADSDDSTPSPPEPSGGAVVGLGALAAAAAVRKTPMVAATAPWTNLAGWLGSMLGKVSPLLVGLRYSRYDDSDPLEHDARERVYEIVTAAPGSYLSQVSEEADLPLSTTRHHVRVLEREDLVSGAKLRGKRRFYPAYAEGIELAAALNDEATTGIIDAIARLGAASVSDLAAELDRDPSTISHHLQRLEADDIISRERDGRTVMNTLSAEASTALEPDSTQKTDRPTEVATTGAD